MKPAGIITLTTDFGRRDWFVGIVKGVILGVNPSARLIDVTHDLPPGDIGYGAFALAAACQFFPPGTVHVAVVDPGVGSARGAIAIQTGKFFFVGPDNGVLSWAVRKDKVIAIHKLKNESFFLRPVSATFHARDVFAPVAAHIANGTPLSALGPPINDFVRLVWPEARSCGGEAVGQVLYVDNFGNAITNLEVSALENHGGATLEVLNAGERICYVAEFYQAVPAGEAVAVTGSSGFLEIAINGGSAAKELDLAVGSEILIRKVAP
jgi:S-adenosyl-L-methionine hydrolase (adenosine-forming)